MLRNNTLTKFLSRCYTVNNGNARILLKLEGDFMDEIVRMQENLLLIRRTVGWTASRFGDKIGVTRQTINNIEGGRCKLNKTQYIAMRSVLDAEICSSPNDTKMLQVLLDVLIDNPQNYSEETREKVKEKANMMTPGILVGSVSREAVSAEWMNVFMGVLAIATPISTVLGLASVGGWLMKLVNKKNTSKETDNTSENDNSSNQTATEQPDSSDESETEE